MKIEIANGDSFVANTFVEFINGISKYDTYYVGKKQPDIDRWYLYECRAALDNNNRQTTPIKNNGPYGAEFDDWLLYKNYMEFTQRNHI